MNSSDRRVTDGIFSLLFSQQEELYVSRSSRFAYKYIFTHMSVHLKVLVLSVVCDDLWYVKIKSVAKLKSRISYIQIFFGESFGERLCIYIHIYI